MAEQLYNVVFSGDIYQGRDKSEVVKALATLMKADVSKVEKLFTGNRVVIKKDIPQDQAKKYVTAFDKVGAIAIAEKIPQPEELTSEPEKPAKPATVVSPIKPVTKEDSAGKTPPKTKSKPQRAPLPKWVIILLVVFIVVPLVFVFAVVFFGPEAWVIIGIIVLGYFMVPGSCYVCEIDLKKKSYTWELDGKNRKVCPNCNRKLENKKSSAAMKAKFG